MSMLKLVSAGIAGIPCFLVAIGTAPVVALLSIPTLALLLFRTEADTTTDSDKTDKTDNNNNNNKQSSHHPDQVIITGGSSGIGFSIAKECVQRGIPRITLLARNLEKLEHAQRELQAMCPTTPVAKNNNYKQQQKKKKSRIDVVSVSVSDCDALTQAAKDLQIPSSDRVVLWNCAGFAYPAEFEKVPLAKFEQQVMTNQLGTMYLVRAFLPYLNKGCIVLTSSAAGQVGVYGYSTYAPTKFAIRGFAETLHAELIRSHPQLSVQLAYPVDTDTPGYQEELKTTPEITKKLSEVGGVASADETAKSMVNAAFCKNPKFSVYFTLEGWMLSNLTAGMAPVTSLGDAVTQVALAGLFRLIGLFILNDWWNIIRTFPPASTTAESSSSSSCKKAD